MNTEDLIAGFKSIEDELKADEILALQKFTGMTGTKYIVESFFQEMINCKVTEKPFYSSDNWKSLTKAEKKVLSLKIPEWYKRLLLFCPYYRKRYTYTSEDDLKLKVIFDGEDLGTKEDYNTYLYYLETIKLDKSLEDSSDEIVEWLNKLIVYYRTQVEKKFPERVSQENNFSEGTSSSIKQKQSKKVNRENRIKYKTLRQIFKYKNEYNTIMELLVSKGYCQEGTFVWKDEKGGYKGLVVFFIKNLHFKGYFKRKPSTEEIKLFAEKTFGMEISKDTINRNKPDSYINELNIIPFPKR